jgi:hypothetical protein
MFASIGMDSLRTAALEGLPLGLWEDRLDGAIGHFIFGSLGNPEEEHVRITSINYSDVRSTWETANRNAGIQFGIRPWRTSPYLYLLAHAGHWNSQPLVTFEGRMGYTFFGSARLEGRLSLALPAGFRLGGGVSVDPRTIGAAFDATQAAVTLERVIRFGDSTPAALFYLGFRSGVNHSQPTPCHETLLIVGLSKQW